MGTHARSASDMSAAARASPVTPGLDSGVLSTSHADMEGDVGELSLPATSTAHCPTDSSAAPGARPSRWATRSWWRPSAVSPIMSERPPS